MKSINFQIKIEKIFQIKSLLKFNKSNEIRGRYVGIIEAFKIMKYFN